MKFALVVLAYNESKTIKDVVKEHYKKFDKIIVVNDKSKDDTSDRLEELSEEYTDLIVINNNKNYGAGKSFEIGLKEFLKTDCDYLIKVDGDSQFNHQDTFNLVDIIIEKKYDYIKCDRFWSKGIDGKMPFLRYFGNAFASFLIKFATGNWKINDALNGLFGISRNVSKNFTLPKLFNRYGYPFYLNTFISNYSIINDIKIAQYKNVISYRDEKSNLNPIIMFIKLIYFVITNYFKKIKLKIQVSELQISAILDIFSLILFMELLFSIYKFINIRYFDTPGPQGTWYVVNLIFLVLFIGVLTLSQSQESRFNKNKFFNL